MLHGDVTHTTICLTILVLIFWTILFFWTIRIFSPFLFLNRLVWPNVVQYTGIDGGLYFAEYLGTVHKITPPLTRITAEPARTLKIDVKGVASEMVNQEILAYSRVGAEYRFAVND